MLDDFPKPPTEETIHCWNCALQGLITPAVTLAALGPIQRPLCLACRHAIHAVIDEQLAEGTCDVCSKKGLTALTAPDKGYCAEHEPPELAERRAAGAAHDVIQALGDWHLTMAQEISILLARVADVGIEAGESVDSLTEVLRVSLVNAQRDRSK